VSITIKVDPVIPGRDPIMADGKIKPDWLKVFVDIHAPRPVDTTAFMLRLRLDEGSGEILRNSAPNANPATFRTTILQGEWGETTWLWPDFRMQSSTSKARFALVLERATSVGKATIGHELSTSSKCWRDRYARTT
jgi:hypothetical protein